MKNKLFITTLALLALAFTAVAQPYSANSVGQGRFFFYPNNAAKQDTLANADTITYHVPFKITDLNRYELKLQTYAARLTGTETINVYVQQQLFIDDNLTHWVNTDTIAIGALGSGATSNRITSIDVTGTRIRLYVLASGTTSSAIIRWQGILRRKDGAEN
jgi:opacity protein-like surface antigen